MQPKYNVSALLRTSLLCVSVLWIYLRPLQVEINDCDVQLHSLWNLDPVGAVLVGPVRGWVAFGEEGSLVHIVEFIAAVRKWRGWSWVRDGKWRRQLGWWVVVGVWVCWRRKSGNLQLTATVIDA